jgi:hypothetical protein
MRDPNLVQRAEQAATALEQAWTRWRVRHGLGTGPLPPVSSYVGYSVEEPWGQPRVVLGVEAAEAERLAAILDGDEPARVNGVEAAALPRPRQPAELEAAPAKTIPDEQLPAGIEPAPHVLPESASLTDSSAQSGERPSGSQSRSAAAGGPRPSGSPADVATRLRDLAARVTALHPRSDAHDLSQSEPTQSGLVDDSGAGSSEPFATDSASRAQAVPVPRLRRPRAAASEQAAPDPDPDWSADEAHQPAADSTV